MTKPRVAARRGDIFDGAKDLVVVPCNTVGGVTDFVREKLLRYRIPLPPRGAELGSVRYEALDTTNHIAQFVAFASTAQPGTVTSTDTISKITRSLGDFAAGTPSARILMAPLLGTGYGRLDPIASAKAMETGFKLTAPKDSMLVISVMDASIYHMVAYELPPSAMRKSNRGTKRVFISYTSSTPEHKEWVEELALQLRRSGVEARLDSWHLRPGMDLSQWMKDELSLAEKVIVVCDPAYAERADRRVGGVGWETMIIQGDMLSLPPESTKYLVVVRGSSVAAALPVYLRTKFALHCPSDQGVKYVLDDLILAIEDSILEPPLGNPEPGM